MQLITEPYRALQKDLHARYNYGHGADLSEVRAILDCFPPTWSVLDYGCGQGTLKASQQWKLSYRPIAEYDPAIPGKDSQPLPADIVVCTDVLEHVEPECLDDVLQHIRRLMKKAGIFIIATKPSNKVMADGRNAHVILENYGWWTPKLWEHGFLMRIFRDRSKIGKGILAVVTPR